MRPAIKATHSARLKHQTIFDPLLPQQASPLSEIHHRGAHSLLCRCTRTPHSADLYALRAARLNHPANFESPGQQGPSKQNSWANNRCHACANRQIAKEQTPDTGINIPISGGHNDVELSQFYSPANRAITESASNHLGSTNHSWPVAVACQSGGGSRIILASFEAVKRVESLL